MKHTSLRILVSTSLSQETAQKAQGRAERQLMTMSDYIRFIIKKWINAGAPVREVPMTKFRWPTAAHLAEHDYNELRDVSKRRRVSMAHAIRCAIEWYHEMH